MKRAKNMNVLFKFTNPHVDQELDEITSGLNAKAYFVKSDNAAAAILNRFDIRIFFIEILQIEDIMFLNYVKDHYKKIRIVLVLGDRMERLINTIRGGDYDILTDPIRINDLVALFEAEQTGKTIH